MTQALALDVQALRSLQSTASHDVWLTLRAPVLAVESLMRRSDACCLWAPRQDDPASSTPAVSSVGLGVARRVLATGEQRFASVRRSAEHCLSNLRQVDVQGVHVKPRLFGGLSFVPGTDPGGSWCDFGDAQFVLPQFTYETNGISAGLGVVVQRERLGELDAVMERALRLIRELEAMALESVRWSEEEPPHTIASEMSEVHWSSLVRAALRQIDETHLSKVVLARRERLSFPRQLSVEQTLHVLSNNHPTATRFAFRAGSRTFVGATPEQLVRKSGLDVISEALAGTFRLEMATFAEELLRSPKEHHEHQPVLRAVVETLSRHCSRLEYPDRPQLRRLRSMLHLHTPIVGRLKAPEHVLSLVEELHPTPAVGGVPSDAALRWLRAQEPHERGWYAGPVGWFDANGDGEFCVALRSGLLHGRTAELYAGAGIVRGSEPASEFEETRLKFTALAQALRTE